MGSKKFPDRWSNVLLKDVIKDIGDGGTPSRKKPGNFGGGIPWAVVDDIKFRITTTKETLSDIGLQSSSAKLWPPKTVILTTGASIGNVGLAEVSLATKQGITGIVCDDFRLLPEYLARFFESKVKYLNRIAQGSTFKEVRAPILQRLELLLPTLPEQRKIAAILSSVDNAIEKTKEVIEQTKVLKKGLMQELLTRGIHGRHKKFKKSPIGVIPEEWEVVKLGDLSIDGINNGIFKKKSQYGRGVLLVNVFDTYGSLCVNPSILDRVEATKEEINKYGLRDGDLLFVRSSLKYEGVGQCCMIKQLDEPMVYECHLMRVRPNQAKIDPLFLAYYCNSSQFRQDLLANAKFQTMTTLSQGDIFSLSIPLPTISEQKKISSALGNCDKKNAVNNILQESLKNLKFALMQVLLTGEVRVKTIIQGG